MRAALLAACLVPAVAGLLSPAAARAGCGPDDPGVLFAACPGAARAETLLIPEDLGRLEEEGALTVTGAYTATDAREGGARKPVGLHVQDGTLVNLEFARMDGILVIEDRRPRIAAVDAVPLGGAVHDLRSLAGRQAFVAAAEIAGASVLQSHLLVRDGALDARPVDDAPAARRRLLIETAEGGHLIWDSRHEILTIYQAALRARALGARWALNLDMGGHDWCRRADGRACGLLTRDAVPGRLSNLLRVREAGDGDG